jgi:hypothetical protein
MSVLFWLSWGSESVCKRVSQNAVASYSSPPLGLDHAKLYGQVFQMFDVGRSSRTLLSVLFGAIAMNKRRVV